MLASTFIYLLTISLCNNTVSVFIPKLSLSTRYGVLIGSLFFQAQLLFDSCFWFVICSSSKCMKCSATSVCLLFKWINDPLPITNFEIHAYSIQTHAQMYTYVHYETYSHKCSHAAMKLIQGIVEILPHLYALWYILFDRHR